LAVAPGHTFRRADETILKTLIKDYVLSSAHIV
jgi:hypothetical protein